MPALTRISDVSTGHACFPPTPSVQGAASSVFANNLQAGKVGIAHVTHSCGDTVHPTNTRNVTVGSSTVFIEGVAAARIGDPIACGDAVGQGSPNVFVG